MKLEPGMAYNTKVLNKVFAFLSAIFLISVFWMLLDDYIRPWKVYQVEATKIKQERLAKVIEETEQSLDASEIKALEDEILVAEQESQKHNETIKKIEEEMHKLEGVIHAWSIKKGEANAQVSALTFKAEMSMEHKEHNADKLMQQLKDWKVKFASASDTLKKYELEQKEKKKSIVELNSKVIDLRKELDDKVGKLELLKDAKAAISFDGVSVLRNAPLLDYLDPTLRIEQVVMKNYYDDRYFQQTARVDRCTTCHQMIAKPGFEDRENPYKTHPNLELMVGENSKHPVKEFGCTNCHGGEGHRVHDFQSIAHTPQNSKQAAEWREKYNWHEPHKVPAPMFRLQHTEAACLKCHQGVERIPMADKLNEGRHLLEENGCYSCHKIEGWEHLKKPGPSLYRLAGKVDKEFFKNWVWNPKQFNPKTKMPSFFNQSNNSTPEFKAKNIAEVNALTDFIYSLSEEYTPNEKFTVGNAETGKELVSKIGCLGCHQIDGLDENYNVAQNKRGPYLKGLGSKVSAHWMKSWLKNPTHYDPTTIMPSFRLTDSEASDITAFLMDSKQERFQNLKFAPLDGDIRDELLVESFAAFDTLAHAREKVEAMSQVERTLELGRITLGKYGCYSCHSIKGFEDSPQIGPELTNIGSKPIEQFGWGHQHLAHERDVWIRAHLENPRRWDEGTTKPFKDLSKMPYFDLTKNEIESMVLALLGQVSDYVPLEGMKRLSADEKLAEKGSRVVREKNCFGCHKIDGEGGEILANYQDDLNAGPPFLVQQGTRTKARWLYDFLDNVVPIRSFVEIRMPSFHLTNEERNLVVSYFQHKAEEISFDDERELYTWNPGERQAAIKLFKNLECATCHSHGITSDTPMGPDLRLAGNRLKATWIKRWIGNPISILPHTTMPSFWDGGESPEPEILGGDSEKQMWALTKYVLEMTKNPSVAAELRK